MFHLCLLYRLSVFSLDLMIGPKVIGTIPFDVSITFAAFIRSLSSSSV